MKVLRKVGGFELNYDPHMRMYNISNGDLLSFWFDGHYADELLKMTDDDFLNECENEITID
jgi:hypothetical protein